MEKQWWHEKTAYQIYPKSFYDSNDDGIGDIPGIIEKLDYLKYLGIDIVWISPFYRSPLADQGYDISDYYSIDPVFGTMEDFENLLSEAKKRDIRIVIDLVVNHCSDEHEWFKKACEDPFGRYGRYFYIEKIGEGGMLPSNWRSYFGGNCWEPLPGHPDLVYLHVFHKKQPDLNWENPEVREEIYRMINWWLDNGVAGFRIDAIINIKKPLPFTNYPADREDGLCPMSAVLDHAHGVHEFLQEMAEKTFRVHNAITVGEVFNSKPEELEQFIGEKGCFSTMFDFEPWIMNTDPRGWYAYPDMTPEKYKQAALRSQEHAEGIGYMSNIIENHDEPRGVSHYLPEGECNDDSKKLLAGLYFMLKGLPFIYQGQEIGMENVPVSSISEVDDINAIMEYEVAIRAGCSVKEALNAVMKYSRDNARTPMQWNGNQNAGFTKGSPWLKVNSNYSKINVADQIGKEDSVLEWYRRLISLRKEPSYQQTILYGITEPYKPESEDLMAYYRKGEKTLLVLGNFRDKPQKVELEHPVKKLVLNNLHSLEADNDSLLMKPYQFIIIETE